MLQHIDHREHVGGRPGGGNVRGRPRRSAAVGSGTLAGVTITVYSGQHEQTTQALVDDFQQRTGATVEVKSDDEASLAGQLLQEGAASPADVFFAENPPALTAVQNAGTAGSRRPVNAGAGARGRQLSRG